MSQYTKASPHQDQDENYSLSQKEQNSFNSNTTHYQRHSNQKKPNDFLNNLCVIFLIGLLLVGIVVFTYRYMQMAQKHRQTRYTKDEIRANMQSIDASHELGMQKSKNQQEQKQIDQIYQKVNIQLEKEHIGVNEPKIDSGLNQLTGVQESVQQQQNSMQYKENIQAKIHEEEILDEELTNDEEQEQEVQTDSSLDKQLVNVNSVEEAQLLNDKNDPSQQNTQIELLKEQLQLHQNVNLNYQPQFVVQNQKSNTIQEQTQTPLENPALALPAETLESPQKSEIKEIKESKETEIINQQSKLEIQTNQAQKPAESQVPQTEQTQSTPQTATPTAESTNVPAQTEIKTSSSQLITDKDLYDPIIRVKSKIQQNLKSKFDDLIYIKAGTNITEDQYNKARQRMHLWKYFNPLTGSLELLDEVKYDSEVTMSEQTQKLTLQRAQKVILQERLQYEQKYQVSQYNEIAFCIIIPSYKNQDKYFRNLNSILQQDYQNYHIIYIDDASKDGTAEKVQGYINKYQIPESRLKFIENKVNKKALPNIDYAARRLCNSGQIMAIIDGDDYLIGTQVFKIINARYQKENLVLLYTNHLRVHEPIYLKVGTCIDYPERVKKTRSYRRFSIFPASHLRTFFVDLYWRISIRDLKDYQGGYFTAANDFAIMMPILQMAGQRYEYLSQLTYIYDAGTGYNNFQTKADKQATNFKITKRRHKYPKLEHQLEFEKNLRAKGLMKPLEEKRVANIMEESPGTKLRRNVEKKK